MKDTITIAYRCPECGVAMIGEINVFALMGGETNLRCSCGGSVMSVNYIKSRDTVSLNVPCIACPKAHPYQVALSTFRNSELFILSCSATGLDVAFIGSKAKVIKAVNDNTKELQKLMEFADNDTFDGDEDDGLDIFKDFEHDHRHDDDCDCDECHSNSENENNRKTDEYEYYDAVVTSQMLYIIKELYDTEKIKCDCEKSDLILDVGFDTIEISCDVCQARRVLRSRTDADIIALAELDELILE